MGLSAQATRRGPKLNSLFQILSSAVGPLLLLLVHDALPATDRSIDPNPTSVFADAQYAPGYWPIASGGDASW